MIEIGDKIISRDLFEVLFVCDYEKCKGICCIEGDSGAPLQEDEIEEINKALPIIKDYLSIRALQEIDSQGSTIIDNDGDLVTPTVDNRECVYAIFDSNGNCQCAFERAYFENKIEFQKPISCALYPIRLTKYKDFTAVNYHKWSICKCALKLGKKNDTPVFRFLKAPLQRAFGKEFYTQLEEAYSFYLQSISK